ncbi:MAG: hypothetical protein JSS60_03275 [Verrucomicrobia bacterium]|nr:hypothetical protein [Verrucomicrobiota bacterium]
MAVHSSLLHRLDALNTIAWRIYSFDLPLITGAVRKGLLLCIKDFEGNEKWGEIAPYPGRSIETLEQALQQAIDFLNGNREQELFPSVQFGLENALGLPFSATAAPLYAFLSGSYDKVLRQAETAGSQSYTTVKVKLSPFSVEQAKALLKTLQKRFRLRVDCNSAYTMDEALDLFSAFDAECFDYIEDPTFQRDRLSEFHYPLALDETVSHYLTLPLESYPKLYGFILKPTILGGIKGCAPYVEFAKRNKLNVVFSPAFESGLGLLQILFLAKHFDLLRNPLGLDTYRYLKCDLLAPPVNFNTPKLTVTQPPRIHLQLLTEIAHGTSPLPHL